MKKLKTFTYEAQVALVGGSEFASRKAERQAIALLRQDVKDFRLSVREIAGLCRTNHIFPHDLFPKNPALAEQVIAELVRQQDERYRKFVGDERVK